MSTPSSSLRRLARHPGQGRVVAVLGLALVLASCGASASPSPSASPSASPSPTPGTPAPTATASLPSPTASPTVTPSLAPTPTPSTGVGRWLAAGPLAGPTAGPATVLGDGRVLVVGTNDNNDPVAWLWDPATRVWSGTAALPKTRQRQALLTLADGRGLVIGGQNENGQSFSSTYAFDPATEHWNKTVVLSAGRTDPAAVVLRDGRVLVMGGVFQSGFAGASEGIVLAAAHVDRPRRGSSSLDDVTPEERGAALATTELLDPKAGSSTAGPAMRYARAGALATVLADGRVLVVGSIGPEDGVRVDTRAQSTAEIFDPSTGRFSLTGSFPAIDAAALEAAAPKGANPIPTGEPAQGEPGVLVALPDGGAVLIGRHVWWKHQGEVGRSFRFDAGSNQWSVIGQTYAYVGEPTRNVLTTPGVPSLAGATVAGLPDGRVLIAGGVGPAVYVDNGYMNPTSDTAQLFDPTSGAFTPAPKMPGARQFGVAVSLRDGSVLTFGGYVLTAEGSDGVPPARFVPGS